MKPFMKKFLIAGLLALSLTALAACDSSDELVFGQGDWDSNAFHDEVARFIIENGFDVRTRSVMSDTAVTVQSLRSGDLDVSMEIWSDNIPSYPSDLAAGLYEELSVNFADNAQGLYIPRYIYDAYPGLRTVQDLPDYVDLFAHPEIDGMGIIYGGPEGWSATAFLNNKMEALGLDEMFEFRTIDSNAILSATIADAFANEEPWVGYNWEPTWIMGIYDLVLLEDDPYSAEDFELGLGAFPSVSVNVVVRPGFADEYPDIAAFLSQYQTSSDLTSIALGYMIENEVEAYDAALWFLDNHRDMWTAWLPADVAERVLTALDLALE
jgi:glycine betaine/proline transport system substrate-binding protein